MRLAPLPWALGLAACAGGAPDALPPGDPARPDIVLLSVDTLRADHLGAYGHSRDTSPFFDRLARDGVRFAHGRSASPWTLPAHTTMLSGQLPMRHMVVEDKLQLDAGVPVLPELLQGKGYRTAAFVSTFYVSSLFGFQRGFDRFEDFGIHSSKKNLEGDVSINDVVNGALRWWADQPPEQPVFLFLHTYDVHYEYDPPAPYDTMFDRAPQKGDVKYKSYEHFQGNLPDEAQMAHQVAQYDEAIRSVDDAMARLAEAAAKAGRQVRFVITADHGEEFGERGSWGHAHTLYAEQLHVPMILSGGGLPAGVVVEGPAGTHDLAPTIAAWAGAAGLLADGVDLAPALSGAPLPPRPFPAETTRFKTNRIGLYDGGLRLEWDIVDNTRQLFDPAADPKEARDLAAERPADVDRLSRALLRTLGTPWVATAAGEVRTGGFIFKDCARKGKREQVAPGDRLLVLPYDANVRFFPAGGGPEQGPWQGVGGAPPAEGQGLRWEGTRTGGVELSDDQLAALEALGYVQAGSEGSPGGQAAPEPTGDPAAGSPPAGSPPAGDSSAGTPSAGDPCAP